LAALDVLADSVILDVPGKYHLDCKLPLKVDYADEGRGKAIFDKSKKVLHVKLEECGP
jgi:hypothetical protein